MDDIVQQAMARWPNVPHCYGWLGLDGRGNWYLRDDAAQSAGSFSSGAPGAKGSLLQHAGLISFIQRNYMADETGRWYFQNGPQRVFVELEVTPWIWRISERLEITAHDATPTHCEQCLLDERGWLYLLTPLGLGRVHTQDMEYASQAIEANSWDVHPVQSADLPARYHYVLSPQAK